MADLLDIPIVDETGVDLGFSIKLGPELDTPEPEDESGVKTLASRIAGWTALQIDGAPYTFSKARALGLIQRFPHMAGQLRKGAKAGGPKAAAAAKPDPKAEPNP